MAKKWVRYFLIVYLHHFESAQGKGHVNGNLILFNANGAWCWFQDERVLVDSKAGTYSLDPWHLLVVFLAINAMAISTLRPFHFESGMRQTVTLAKHFQADDHSAPRLPSPPRWILRLPYAKQNVDKQTHFRTSLLPNDSSEWMSETVF